MLQTQGERTVRDANGTIIGQLKRCGVFIASSTLLRSREG
ncbi:hypothetical protein PL9214650436 [Planktothrix tepida PCC 9214]|uniref:Uncharacterized protein n=1 Tax=Planktothrix tepida PCC 9214 TaxID=671072 RepID=A0A1J1LR26_9CYAN|nr:hypothetical protein PL9214650436 [Planktothrix tepida PCC 9214]